MDAAVSMRCLYVGALCAAGRGRFRSTRERGRPMDISNLTDAVPAQIIVWIVIVLAALIALVVVVWKRAVATFENARRAVNDREERIARLEKHESKIGEMEKLLQKTKDELDDIITITQLQERCIERSQMEDALIINTLLGIVQGLQELGANGPTRAAEQEILQYLNQASHEKPPDIMIGILAERTTTTR